MHTLLHSVPPALQQATADPHLHPRLLDTHRQVWVSLLWGHCSFLLDPGGHNVLFVPSKSLFPQSCLSSGISKVRLIVTSSKKAMPYPGLLHPEPLPLQQATADPYLFRRHSDKVVSVSVESLGPDFTPPTILLGLLCPWMWGISSQYLCHHAAATPAPHSHSVSP